MNYFQLILLGEQIPMMSREMFAFKMPVSVHQTRTRVRARRGDEQTRGQREGVVRMRQRLRVSVRESACVRAMMSPGVSDGSPNNETPKTKK